MHQTPQPRIAFENRDVETVHADVERSTFPDQKMLKTDDLGPLLEVETSEKCPPLWLWRVAHFEVKGAKK